MEAMGFIAFVTSPKGQKIILDYVSKGARFFYPDAVPSAIAGSI